MHVKILLHVKIFALSVCFLPKLFTTLISVGEEQIERASLVLRTFPNISAIYPRHAYGLSRTAHLNYKRLQSCVLTSNAVVNYHKLRLYSALPATASWLYVTDYLRRTNLPRLPLATSSQSQSSAYLPPPHIIFLHICASSLFFALAFFLRLLIFLLFSKSSLSFLVFLFF